MEMRRHSTETLMGLTKRELVEYVRIAEYNQDVAEEALNQQAENVKDWLPVVRCKDCQHYKTMTCSCSCTCVTENWYCADGERRTDNGN